MARHAHDVLTNGLACQWCTRTDLGRAQPNSHTHFDTEGTNGCGLWWPQSVWAHKPTDSLNLCVQLLFPIYPHYISIMYTEPYSYLDMIQSTAPLWLVSQQRVPPLWPAPVLQYQCCRCLTGKSSQTSPGPKPQGPTSRYCLLCWRNDREEPLRERVWERKGRCEEDKGGKEWERSGGRVCAGNARTAGGEGGREREGKRRKRSKRGEE